MTKIDCNRIEEDRQNYHDNIEFRIAKLRAKAAKRAFRSQLDATIESTESDRSVSYLSGLSELVAPALVLATVCSLIPEVSAAGQIREPGWMDYWENWKEANAEIGITAGAVAGGLGALCMIIKKTNKVSPFAIEKQIVLGIVTPCSVIFGAAAGMVATGVLPIEARMGLSTAAIYYCGKKYVEARNKSVESKK